nr:integrase, catalytic region, zinc finger, CCHC-type, peptidase aspartic, catalytic [Tanacetum cinerariifolium]
MTGDRLQLVNFVQKFIGTVKFKNDHMVKIMGYGDYQIGNMTISRVYYVKGLGHNLFSVGQFCDSDLEVAFRQHTCFICNLDGVDLLTGSQGNSLYTLSLQHDGVLTNLSFVRGIQDQVLALASSLVTYELWFTTTTEVPSRNLISLETDTPKPIVTLVYSRKPRKSKTTDIVSKFKAVQIILWYLDSGCSKHMTRDRSQLTNFVNKFLGTVKFGNDHVAKIMGYGDYQIRKVTISRVYYVEGLGHNLFSVGQLYDQTLKLLFVNTPATFVF